MCQKLRLVKRPFRSRSKQCEFAAQMQKGKVGITWLTERLFHVQPWIVKCTVTRYSKISLFRRPLILLSSSLSPFDIFFSYFQPLIDDHNLQNVSKNSQSSAIELAKWTTTEMFTWKVLGGKLLLSLILTLNTPLFGDRRGYMLPLLKKKIWFECSEMAEFPIEMIYHRSQWYRTGKRQFLCLTN